MIISRDKSLLCPAFAVQLGRFEGELAKVHLPFSLFEGLRTFDQQADYYAQGRTKPGKIITNAQPGDSYHQYGLAADYVLDAAPDLPGMQWSWDVKADLNKNAYSDWLQMAEIAVSCGLEAGYFWKRFPDLPHLQNRFGLTLSDCKELYKIGGIKKVWENCHENQMV